MSDRKLKASREGSKPELEVGVVVLVERRGGHRVAQHFHALLEVNGCLGSLNTFFKRLNRFRKGLRFFKGLNRFERGGHRVAQHVHTLLYSRFKNDLFAESGERFHGGLISKAHRRLHHSRVPKKRERARKKWGSSFSLSGAAAIALRSMSTPSRE